MRALLLLALLPLALRAQPTVDALVHRTAQAYVNEDRAAARTALERGLALAPQDARLLALKALLDREPPQGQGTPPPTPQQQPPQDSGGDQQEPPPQQNPPPQKPPQSDAEAAPQRPDDSRSESGESRPSRLSREEAERLLQALEHQEERLARQRMKAPAAPRRVEKDW